MVSRVALLVWVLESKKAFWLYEQPHSSLLFQHPRMQQIVRKLSIYRCHMHMGSYGAASPKPTFLWAPTPWVYRFSIPLPADREWEPTVTKKVRADGSVQVTGNETLKGTQAYPQEFGLATVRVWRHAVKRLIPKTPAVWGPPCSVWTDPKDKWKDADLSEVFQFLSLGTLSGCLGP